MEGQVPRLVGAGAESTSNGDSCSFPGWRVVQVGGDRSHNMKVLNANEPDILKWAG